MLFQLFQIATEKQVFVTFKIKVNIIAGSLAINNLLTSNEFCSPCAVDAYLLRLVMLLVLLQLELQFGDLSLLGFSAFLLPV